MVLVCSLLGHAQHYFQSLLSYFKVLNHLDTESFYTLSSWYVYLNKTLFLRVSVNLLMSDGSIPSPKIQGITKRIPIASKINNTGSRHILKDMNSPLGLPIHLRMKCGIKFYQYTQLSLNSSPKVRCELSASIWNNGNRHPMQTDDLSNMDMSQLL